MRFLVITFLIIVLSAKNQKTFAQEVEHNFEMPAQKTNCDSLNLNSLDEDGKILAIEAADFRSKQDIKLNRMDGFQAAWFYSCNNNSGYIIAKIDNKKRVFENIGVNTWNEFISSGDFLGYIDKNFDKK